VGTAVGVSVGRNGSVGGISVAGGGEVAVETRGEVGEVQEERRKRKEARKMRDVRWCRGMEGILTEMSGSLAPAVVDSLNSVHLLISAATGRGSSPLRSSPIPALDRRSGARFDKIAWHNITPF